LFWRKGKTSKWKIDFYDSVYKIYDKGGNLTGYFFPNYPKVQTSRDGEAMKLSKSHSTVVGGRLMLPLVRLDLPDVDRGQSLEDLIHNFGGNVDKVREWKEWFESNKVKYHIQGHQIYTAREDKQMLSIVFELGSQFNLGTKQVSIFLAPILENLSEQGIV
jgi:hypothetical protein